MKEFSWAFGLRASVLECGSPLPLSCDYADDFQIYRRFDDTSFRWRRLTEKLEHYPIVTNAIYPLIR